MSSTKQKHPFEVMRHDTWVAPYLVRYRKVLLASLGLGVAALAFAVALMFTSGYLISASAEHPEWGVYALLTTLGCVQLFGLGKPFLSYYERLYSHDWVLRMTSHLRERLYRSFESEGMLWATSHRLGDALGLLAEDIGHVQNLYLRCVFPLVVAYVSWLLVTIVLGVFSWWFGAFFLLAIGVTVVLLPLVSVAVNGARQARTKAARSRLYADVLDDVAGLADWTFAQRQDELVARVAAANEELDHAGAQAASFSRIRDVAVQFVFGVVALVLLVWAACYFAGALQPGPEVGAVGRPADWAAAFVLGFFPLTEAFASVSEGLVQGCAHLDSLERLNAMKDPDVVDEQQGEAACLPERVSGSVVIDRCSFAYEGAHDLVLDGLSLTVESGEVVAILGPSGTGKSTLASLIRGDVVPTGGSVTLDGIPTVSFGRAISKQVVLMRQEDYLFNQTLLDNLRIGNPDATRDQAAAALRQVGLGGLLDRLPEGLDTLVDEAGLRFSGGERHRVALARVLLQDAPIVVLDEPTVSLDPVTERALLATVFEVLAGRTVIVITHHLVGVEHMDRVVFLEEGGIAMQGTPAELHAASERFRALLELDFCQNLRS